MIVYNIQYAGISVNYLLLEDLVGIWLIVIAATSRRIRNLREVQRLVALEAYHLH